MFKLYYTIIIACFISATLLSQGDCTGSTAKDRLNVNNINANIGVSDMISFIDYPTYEYPKGSGISALFNANLWMGGYDDQGQLKLAAQTYRQSGTDFYPGPIPEEGTTPAVDICSEYDKLFTVYGEDIDNFASIYNANNGVIEEVDIPESMRNYPGKNNPFLQGKMYLPQDRDIAPFYDLDGDGDYNPMNGDHPSLENGKPAFADQMIFKVINDAGNVHTESGGEIMKMEIGVMAYSFQTEDELNNATFFNYTLNYRGSSTLNDFYLGIFVDPDLGQWDNDYVGCIPDENIGYVYNGPEIDLEYETIPILGIQILEGMKNEMDEEIKMTSFLAYYNDFSVNGNPETALQHYNYLRSNWKDGSSVIDNNNEETTLMYPGDPSNTDEWSECNSGEQASDKRFIMAMGTVNFEPGESKTFKKCILITNKQSHYCGDTKISDLTDLGDMATAFVENDFGFTGSPIEMPEDTTTVEPEDTTTLALSEFRANQLKVNTYPNPASNFVFFEFNSPDVRFDKLIIRSIEGLEVYNTDISVASKKIQMNRGSLKSGVYFYQFYDKEKIITTGKFIFE